MPELITVYCIGVIAEGVYMAVKRATWSTEKIKRFNAERSEMDAQNGINSKTWIPVALVVMCLIWPYMWIDRLLLKRVPRQ